MRIALKSMASGKRESGSIDALPSALLQFIPTSRKRVAQANSLVREYSRVVVDCLKTAGALKPATPPLIASLSICDQSQHQPSSEIPSVAYSLYQKGQ